MFRLTTAVALAEWIDNGSAIAKTKLCKLELPRFTHTSKRKKYRNIAANPKVAMSVIDPDNSHRFIEVRGVVEEEVVEEEVLVRPSGFSKR